jgi:hypothetical protein
MSEKTVGKIVESAFYFLAAIAEFLLVKFFLAELLSRFADFWETIPYFLYLSLVVYLLFILHLIVHPLGEKKRMATAKINGAILCILSFVAILYFAILFRGYAFPFLAEGGITPLYPLDGFMGSFFLLFAGTGIYLFGRQIEKHPRKYPYNVHEWTKHGKIWTSIFRPLFVLVALYFLGAGLSLNFLSSWSSNHLFGMIGFYLLMILPSAMIALYEWNYLDKEPLPQRQRLYRNSVIMTLISLLLALWYWLAQALDPLFLMEDGASVLIIDGLANIKLGPYLLLLFTLLSSLISFFHYLDRNGPKKPKNA